MVAANIANLNWGGDHKSDQSANLHLDRVSRQEAAEAVNVGNNERKESYVTSILA
jgi:hypothetical protein